MVCRALIAVVTVVALSGCVTSGLGRPPTNADLRNDGSPADQQALLDEYTLAYRDGLIVRPGASPEEVGVSFVQAPAYGEEAQEYLSTSSAAALELEGGSVAFDRFVRGGAGQTALTTSAVLLGATLGMASTIPGIVAAMEAGDPSRISLFGVTTAIGVGALSGVFASVPLSLVYYLALWPLAQVAAEGDYRRAVRAYNQELEVRIEAAAEGQGPVGSGAPSPAPSTPPAPEPAVEEPAVEEPAEPEPSAVAPSAAEPPESSADNEPEPPVGDAPPEPEVPEASEASEAG